MANLRDHCEVMRDRRLPRRRSGWPRRGAGHPGQAGSHPRHKWAIRWIQPLHHLNKPLVHPPLSVKLQKRNGSSRAGAPAGNSDHALLLLAPKEAATRDRKCAAHLPVASRAIVGPPGCECALPSHPARSRNKHSGCRPLVGPDGSPRPPPPVVTVAVSDDFWCIACEARPGMHIRGDPSVPLPQECRKAGKSKPCISRITVPSNHRRIDIRQSRGGKMDTSFRAGLPVPCYGNVYEKGCWPCPRPRPQGKCMTLLVLRPSAAPLQYVV
ncbi:hypothetical protein CALCODRAFT_203051 [Calocera cornea HHB12733]|uniref:Uncharacterized protein n=1 Tax=Calocera cornea HHB12733 TaxID=1353952 RepID=A0A165JYC4_9BASI|nr:hypothetical protein CALCODRAFT_203051 [Calocera cornea HHB12733]